MRRFLTMRQVCELTTLSRRTIMRLVDAGDFPMPVRITSGRRAWRAEYVEDWMKEPRNTLARWRRGLGDG